MPDESITVHFPFPPGNDFQAAVWIRYIFHEIARHQGEANAAKLFREFGRPLKPATLRMWRNWRLLSRLDAMKEPEPYALARDLVRENERMVAEGAPAADRWGPNGTTEIRAMEKQIVRLIERRKLELKAGTWRGPGAPGYGVITGAAITVSY